MTDIIFSFDTEDYTSNTAADAILMEARILREEGVRGCFNTVGLLARALEKWGRQDVIEELRYHELGLHSYGHTLHPTIHEYTDIADFDKAYALVRAQETEAASIINRVLGHEQLYAACPPGWQTNYVAMYAYADMGIPIYTGFCCDTKRGDGAYYCNLYQMQQDFGLERILFDCTDEQLQALIDERFAKKKRVVIFTHPDNAINVHTWDRQFSKYNQHEFDQWVETEHRPMEETERFYQNMRRLVRMIKNDKRFHITTFSEYAKRLENEQRRVVTLADIPALRTAIERELYPTKIPMCLSLSDIAYACRDLLTGKEAHECGRVYGFLEVPYAITEPLTLSAADVRASASQIGDRFIPASITVGNHTIGPADWLRAALAVLCGEDTVSLSPAPQMPSLTVFDVVPRLDTVNFKGKWMFSDDFEDRYLSDRLRLQCWTMRFPEI